MRENRCLSCACRMIEDDSEIKLCLLCRPAPTLRINFGGRPIVNAHTKDGVKRYYGVGA